VSGPEYGTRSVQLPATAVLTHRQLLDARFDPISQTSNATQYAVKQAGRNISHALKPNQFSEHMYMLHCDIANTFPPLESTISTP